jgi:hypothetical protein
MSSCVRRLLPYALLVAPILITAQAAEAQRATRTAASAASTSAALAPVVLDSSWRAAYRWRNIGPDRGGRSIAATACGRPLTAESAGRR